MARKTNDSQKLTGIAYYEQQLKNQTPENPKLTALKAAAAALASTPISQSSRKQPIEPRLPSDINRKPLSFQSVDKSYEPISLDVRGSSPLGNEVNRVVVSKGVLLPNPEISKERSHAYSEMVEGRVLAKDAAQGALERPVSEYLEFLDPEEEKLAKASARDALKAPKPQKKTPKTSPRRTKIGDAGFVHHQPLGSAFKDELSPKERSARNEREAEKELSKQASSVPSDEADLGGGLQMPWARIEEIAKSRVQPTLANLDLRGKKEAKKEEKTSKPGLFSRLRSSVKRSPKEPKDTNLTSLEVVEHEYSPKTSPKLGSDQFNVSPGVVKSIQQSTPSRMSEEADSAFGVIYTPKGEDAPLDMKVEPVDVGSAERQVKGISKGEGQEAGLDEPNKSDKSGDQLKVENPSAEDESAVKLESQKEGGSGLEVVSGKIEPTGEAKLPEIKDETSKKELPTIKDEPSTMKVESEKSMKVEPSESKMKVDLVSKVEPSNMKVEPSDSQRKVEPLDPQNEVEAGRAMKVEPSKMKVEPADTKTKVESSMKVEPSEIGSEKNVKVEAPDSKMKVEPSELKVESSKSRKPEASRMKVEPTDANAEAPETKVEPSKVEPSGTKVEPSGTKVEPSGTKVEPSGTKVEPSGTKVEPSKIEPADSKTKVEPANMKVEPSNMKVEPVDIGFIERLVKGITRREQYYDVQEISEEPKNAQKPENVDEAKNLLKLEPSDSQNESAKKVEPSNLKVEPSSSMKVEPGSFTELSKSKVEPSKVEPSKVEPSKVEPSKVEPSKVEPSKVEPSKVEPSKVEPSKVEPSKVEPSKVEPSEVTPSKVEPSSLNDSQLKLESSHTTKPGSSQMKVEPSSTKPDTSNSIKVETANPSMKVEPAASKVEPTNSSLKIEPSSPVLKLSEPSDLRKAPLSSLAKEPEFEPADLKDLVIQNQLLEQQLLDPNSRRKSLVSLQKELLGTETEILALDEKDLQTQRLSGEVDPESLAVRKRSIDHRRRSLAHDSELLSSEEPKKTELEHPEESQHDLETRTSTSVASILGTPAGLAGSVASGEDASVSALVSLEGVVEEVKGKKRRDSLMLRFKRIF